MKKILFVGVPTLAALGAAAIWVFGLPEHPTHIVSQEYNFSAAFPDRPDVETGINDEGLPKTTWTVKHDHVTWAEYFQVSATCYKETLDPDKEFRGADTDPSLVLNGVKILKSERFTIQAAETNRVLSAFSRVSEDMTLATGNMFLHTAIIDGHCWIDAMSRADR